MNQPQQVQRREQWRNRIARQEAAGQSVRAFCQDEKINEHSFYAWRKQLRDEKKADRQPVRFALVETRPAAATGKATAETGTLELIMANGTLLRIPAEEATLRMVLAVVGNQTA